MWLRRLWYLVLYAFWRFQEWLSGLHDVGL